MKKITDKKLQEIENLIDKKKWEEAENILVKLSKTGDSRVNFLLGHIYDAWGNPNKNENKAIKYFGLAAESTHPIPGAFIRLSRIEKNKTHSIRILRKGLQSFPESETIYYRLLNLTESSKREDIFKEIILQKCTSERIKTTMATTYFDLNKYTEVIEILSGIIVDNEWDRNIVSCIKGFSLYEMNKFIEANEIFSKLVEEDLNHKLHYIPHLGLVLVLLNQEKYSKAEKLFEEIPIDEEIYEGLSTVLEPGPWGDIYLDAREYIFRTIDLIINKTKQNKIVGIARGLRGLLRLEELEENTTKKGLQTEVKKDLEFSIKEFPENKLLAKSLFRLFKNSNLSKAWQYLIQYSLYDDEYFHGDDFIENASGQLF